MKKNAAGQYIKCLMMTTAGAPITAGVTMVIVADSGAQAAGVGTLTHTGNGVWLYIPTQAETNYDDPGYLFVNPNGTNHQLMQVYTIPYITAQNVAGTDVRSLPAVAMEVVGTNVISPSGSGANPAYVAET